MRGRTGCGMGSGEAGGSGAQAGGWGLDCGTAAALGMPFPLPPPFCKPLPPFGAAVPPFGLPLPWGFSAPVAVGPPELRHCSGAAQGHPNVGIGGLGASWSGTGKGRTPSA